VFKLIASQISGININSFGKLKDHHMGGYWEGECMISDDQEQQ